MVAPLTKWRLINVAIALLLVFGILTWQRMHLQPQEPAQTNTDTTTQNETLHDQRKP